MQDECCVRVMSISINRVWRLWRVNSGQSRLCNKSSFSPIRFHCLLSIVSLIVRLLLLEFKSFAFLDHYRLIERIPKFGSVSASVALVTCGPTDPIPGCCFGFTLHPWLCSILPVWPLPSSVRRCSASGASLRDDKAASNSTGSLDC